VHRAGLISRGPFAVVAWALITACHGPPTPAPRWALRLLAGRPGGLGDRDGAAADARFDFPTGLAWDGVSHLYVADGANHALRRVSLADGSTETVAGGAGPGSADGPAGISRLNHPSALAWDGTGSLYVADQGNRAIRMFDPSSRRLSTVVREGLRAPSGLCFLAGRLWVADEGAAAIWSFDPAGGAPHLVAGRPGSPGDADGSGSEARFRAPEGLAADGAGHLFVTDAGARSLRRIDLSTGRVSTVLRGLGLPRGLVFEGGRLYFADALDETVRWMDAATGVNGRLAGFPGLPGGADGTGVAARFAGPAALASLGGAALVVADEATVRRIDLPDGTARTLAGRPLQPGATDGRGGAASFRAPWGLASAAGALFVADSGNGTFRRIDPTTGSVVTVAGLAGAAGDIDGRGTVSRFERPMSLAAAGPVLYVADPWGHRVRRLDVATGAIGTVAGGVGGFTDGPGAAARFCGPSAIASDGTGALLVADHPFLDERDERDGEGDVDGDEPSRAGCGAIRRLDLATSAVTTLAGSAAEEGEVDGRFAEARFDSPVAIVCAGKWCYVADEGGDTVRRLDLVGHRVTTLAGEAGQPGERDGRGAGARFDGPRALALDGRGGLLVADGSGAALRRIELATDDVTTLLGGSASGLTLHHPAGLLALGGVVYLTDAAENVLLVAAPQGE
jgi:DNA-binding beta-propeller fold protein YncE